jgi:glycerophosphoryl diester phosphodiesterase
VIHDATVDRTTNGGGAVRAFRARDLAALDAGRGERIPLLEEVLEHFPDTPLIIEVKTVAGREAVAAAVRRHGAADRVLVGSFHWRALRPFRRWHCAASRPEIALFWGLSRFGLASPGSRYSAFAVPERYGRIHIVDAAFVRMATAQGKPVHVWTVNERNDAARLRALGVAGIVTDYPARLLAGSLARSSDGCVS